MPATRRDALMLLTVENYIRENPGLSSGQIKTDLGISHNRWRYALMDMRNRGVDVKSKRLPGVRSQSIYFIGERS